MDCGCYGELESKAAMCEDADERRFLFWWCASPKINKLSGRNLAPTHTPLARRQHGCPRPGAKTAARSGGGRDERCRGSHPRRRRPRLPGVPLFRLCSKPIRALSRSYVGVVPRCPPPEPMTAVDVLLLFARYASQDRKGVTPLMLACEHGSVDVVRALLAAGAPW